MKDSKASAKRLKGAENRGRALELRKSGASYRQIGEALGISLQRAHQLIMNELDRLSQLRLGTADELRRLELERLEMIALAIVSQVKKGDIKAGHLWLKTCESRRKLLGLDAPARAEISGPDGGPIETTDAKERLLVLLSR